MGRNRFVTSVERNVLPKMSKPGGSPISRETLGTALAAAGTRADQVPRLRIPVVDLAMAQEFLLIFSLAVQKLTYV